MLQKNTILKYHFIDQINDSFVLFLNIFTILIRKYQISKASILICVIPVTVFSELQLLIEFFIALVQWL